MGWYGHRHAEDAAELRQREKAAAAVRQEDLYKAATAAAEAAAASAERKKVFADILSSIPTSALKPCSHLR